MCGDFTRASVLTRACSRNFISIGHLELPKSLAVNLGTLEKPASPTHQITDRSMDSIPLAITFCLDQQHFNLTDVSCTSVKGGSSRRAHRLVCCDVAQVWTQKGIFGQSFLTGGCLDSTLCFCLCGTSLISGNKHFIFFYFLVISILNVGEMKIFREYLSLAWSHPKWQGFSKPSLK